MDRIPKMSVRDSRTDELRDIFEKFDTCANTGRATRSVLGRRIAFAVWPEVFEVLDYENDALFLEPLLFLAGAVPEIIADLPALLNPSKLPEQLNCSPFFVPGCGYFDFQSGEAEPAKRLKSLSLLLHGTQGLQTLAGEHDTPGLSAEPLIRQAVDCVSVACPDVFAVLERACGRIVPFMASKTNSFVSEVMPGTIFLNLSHNGSLAAIVEDVAHQTMHCLFSDIEQAANIFTKPASDKLSDHCDFISGERTISFLHHSCLTLAVSCRVLESVLSASKLNATDRLEIRARIGFLCKKMAIDLTTARSIDALTTECHDLFWTLISLMRPINPPSEWSYSSQGYNFCFNTFCNENSRILCDQSAEFGNLLPIRKD